MIHIVKKRAISLMEVIVLMAAVSFLAGVFINMMFFSSAVSSIKKTGDRIASIKKAIEHYVDQNGVLPCAASLEADYMNAQYGTAANCSTTLPAGVFSSGQGENEVVQGWVPFKTLGLRERDAYDAWGRRLRYVVVRNLTKDYRSFLTYQPKANGAIVVLDKDNKSIIDTSKHVVAYMLISHGKKEVGSYDKNGKSLVCNYQNMPAQPKEIDNCNNDSTFFYAEPSFTFDASYNDDIMQWFFLDSISSSIAKNSNNPYGRRYFVVKDFISKGSSTSRKEDGIYLLEDSKGVVNVAGWGSDASNATAQKIPAIALMKDYVVHGILPCKRNDLILTADNLLFSVNDDGDLVYQPQTRAGVVTALDLSLQSISPDPADYYNVLTINTSSSANVHTLHMAHGNEFFSAYVDEKTVALTIGVDGRLYQASLAGGKVVGWREMN